MRILQTVLIELGLAIDPRAVAGRPDRFVPENGEEAELIPWGRGERYGSFQRGDCWGEWEVAKPPTAQDPSPPPPEYTPLESGNIPFREG